MSGLSYAMEDSVLNILFKNTSHPITIAAPQNYFPLHIGLSRANPLGDASGLDEPSGGGYTRVDTVVSDWDFASGGETVNGNTIIFPEATGNWGEVTHFALFGGDEDIMLVYGELVNIGGTPTPRTIVIGDVPRFEAGTLKAVLGG